MREIVEATGEGSTRAEPADRAPAERGRRRIAQYDHRHAQAPDLFVVCKNCGSEVSSFVTECPYCGARLRKRAPKLERGRPSPTPGRGAPRAPRLPRLRPARSRASAPIRRTGRRHDRARGRCALLGAIAAGGVRSRPRSRVVGSPDGEWWRVATAPFFCDDLLYAAALRARDRALRRAARARARPARAAARCSCSAASAASPSPRRVETVPFAAGANGAALALTRGVGDAADRSTCAPRREPEGDLSAPRVFAAVLLLMPLAVEEASATAGAVGAARRHRRRRAARPPPLRRSAAGSLSAVA